MKALAALVAEDVDFITVRRYLAERAEGLRGAPCDHSRDAVQGERQDDD
jgi:hypothetical protein